MADTFYYVNTASAGGDGTGGIDVLSGSTAAYASLSAAEAARQGTVGGGAHIIFECKGTTADTPVTFSGWNVNGGGQITIRGHTSGRHAGVYSTSAYRIESDTASGILLGVSARHVNVEYLQFSYTGTYNLSGWVYLGTSSEDTKLSRNIFKQVGTDSTEAAIRKAYAEPALIAFNIFYDLAGTALLNSAGAATDLYNNTFVDCEYIHKSTGSALAVFKNNLIKGSTSGIFDTVSSSSDYNATDGSTFGAGYSTNTNDRVSQTFTFANEASDNFHLGSSDTGALDFGVDLSGVTDSIDIDGDAITGTWSIGADFFVGVASQDISPTGIASAESFGTAVITTGAVTLSPTGIASAESFGTATVANITNLSPTGIASAESFGTAVITTGAVTLSPTGIASAESFGTAVITTGAVTLSPTGIASAESFGTAVITSSVDLAPTGIASAELFGTAVITTGAVTLSPTGIASAESFGTAAITTGAVTLSPTGIASAESFGTAIVANTVILSPTGIASAESFGTAVITTGAVTLSPTGIASAESFGTAVITSSVDLAPTGIASAESFGTAVITTGAVTLSPTGIASAESFGTAVITTGAVTLSPTGIASAESFGTAVVTAGDVLSPTGIASAESFGTAVITTGAVTLSPTGISSGEIFGTASVGIPSIVPSTTDNRFGKKFYGGSAGKGKSTSSINARIRREDDELLEFVNILGGLLL